MRVEDILAVARDRLITIHTDALLTDAAKLLCDTHRALLVVCDSSEVMAGVITRTDIVRQVARCDGIVNEVRIPAVMTQAVTSCRQGDFLHDLLDVMKQRGFVHIPVLDAKSRPCGVVNARDALHALVREVKNEELLLRSYVMGLGYQ
jgi:signal-transduction protein with cAMP-binding, CBS, and nucleotidyltransferase domain